MASKDDLTELEELVGDILVHGVTTSELMSEMITNYEGSGVEKAIIKRAKKMMNNAEDKQKRVHIAAFVANMGGQYGSERLKNWGKEHTQALKGGSDG